MPKKLDFTLVTNKTTNQKDWEAIMKLNYLDILEIEKKTSKEYSFKKFVKDYKGTFTTAIQKGKEFAIIAREGGKPIGLITAIKSKKGYKPRVGFVFVNPLRRGEGKRS